jgi:hypothetical protein
MPGQRGPRRSRITFSDSAAKQLDAITSEAELHALDRALVVISVDPDAGEPLPGDSTGPRLRQYVDDVERVPAPVLGDGLEDRGRRRLRRGVATARSSCCTVAQEAAQYSHGLAGTRVLRVLMRASVRQRALRDASAPVRHSQ